MNKFFCPNCNKEVSYTIRENLINEYKGQIVNIKENIAVCNECGKDIYVPEIEEDNFNRLYSKYRELTGLISKDEIIKLREKYNMSQRELVAILGWGKMTINRYENGALASKSHSDILKDIIKNEEKFKSIVSEAYELKRITEKTYEKIKKLCGSSRRNAINSLLEVEFKHEESILNGFRQFDIERVENLISYIASKVDNLYKTSLNKYLWFIDFENFKENVRSITGLTYEKQQFGPIIENKGYELIINFLDNKFYKEESENEVSIVTKIKSKNNYDMSSFSKYEMEVIDSVINKLKSMSCTQISEISHEEDGWIKNNINDIISYDYADDLRINF